MPEKIPVSKKDRKLEFETEKFHDTEDIKGKYMIRMYKKHYSATFADAMNIVKKYPYETDEHFLYVVFNEPNDDLENLLLLAKAWKVFKFYIDDIEINKDDVELVCSTLFCEHKKYCEGICYQRIRFLYKGDWRWTSQYEIISCLLDLKNRDIWHNEYLLKNKPWTKKKETAKEIKYSIDKEKLTDSMNEYYSIVKTNCETYNQQKIEKEIQKIQNEFKIPLERSYDIIERFQPEASSYEHFEDKDDFVKEEMDQYILLSEEQINLLARQISKEMEKVLKKLMKDKK